MPNITASVCSEHNIPKCQRHTTGQEGIYSGTGLTGAAAGLCQCPTLESITQPAAGRQERSPRIAFTSPWISNSANWLITSYGPSSVQRIPICSLSPHMPNLNHCHHPQQSVLFATPDDPTMTHRHHRECKVYTMVCSWCTSYELGQMYNDTHPPVSHRVLTPPENPLCSAHSSTFPQ